MCSGYSVFQMRALATGKAREPMEFSRRAGAIRSSEVETDMSDGRVCCADFFSVTCFNI